MLLVEFDSLSGVSEIGAGIAQVAQCVSFSPSVPDLSINNQSLLVEFDSLSGVSEGGASQAQVAQGSAFSPSVPDLT